METEPSLEDAPLLPPPEAADSLIIWMLSLSPAERLDVLQGFVDSAAELGRVGYATV